MPTDSPSLRGLRKRGSSRGSVRELTDLFGGSEHSKRTSSNMSLASSSAEVLAAAGEDPQLLLLGDRRKGRAKVQPLLDDDVEQQKQQLLIGERGKDRDDYSFVPIPDSFLPTIMTDSPKRQQRAKSPKRQQRANKLKKTLSLEEQLEGLPQKGKKKKKKTIPLGTTRQGSLALPLLRELESMASQKKNDTFATFYESDGKPTEKLTYGEVWNLSGVVSYHLRITWKVQKGQTVALVLDYGLHYIYTWLGCLRAGVVPLIVASPVPPNYEPGLTKLNALLQSADPIALILTDSVVKYWKEKDVDDRKSATRKLWPDFCKWKAVDKLPKPKSKKKKKSKERDPELGDDSEFHHSRSSMSSHVSDWTGLGSTLHGGLVSLGLSKDGVEEEEEPGERKSFFKRISDIVSGSSVDAATPRKSIRESIFGPDENEPLLAGTAYDEEALQPTDVACLQATSGSTAEPKIVVVTFQALFESLKMTQRSLSSIFDPQETLRGLSWVPPDHHIGLFLSMLCPFLSGCSMHYMSKLAYEESPKQWLTLLSTYRIEWTVAPDNGYRLIIREFTKTLNSSTTIMTHLELSALKILLNVGESPRWNTPTKLKRCFIPYCLPRDCLILAGYGLAEHVMPISWMEQTVAAVPTCAGFAMTKRAAIANKTDLEQENIAVVVIDPKTKVPVKKDQMGEIWIWSPSLQHLPGYFNDKQMSKKIFRAILKGQGTPYLRTGDIGLFKDDQLYIACRKEDVLRTPQGIRFCPPDIEWFAEDSKPQIKPGCVVAFASVAGTVEIALEVFQSTRPLQTRNLCQALSQQIPKFTRMQVSSVVAVPHLTLPRTPIGTVQRRHAKRSLLNETMPIVFDFPKRKKRIDIPDNKARPKPEKQDSFNSLDDEDEPADWGGTYEKVGSAKLQSVKGAPSLSKPETDKETDKPADWSGTYEKVGGAAKLPSAKGAPSLSKPEMGKETDKPADWTGAYEKVGAAKLPSGKGAPRLSKPETDKETDKPADWSGTYEKVGAAKLPSAKGEGAPSLSKPETDKETDKPADWTGAYEKVGAAKLLSAKGAPSLSKPETDKDTGSSKKIRSSSTLKTSNNEGTEPKKDSGSKKPNEDSGREAKESSSDQNKPREPETGRQPATVEPSPTPAAAAAADPSAAKQSGASVPKWKQKLLEKKGTTEKPDKGGMGEAKEPSTEGVPEWKQKLLERKVSSEKAEKGAVSETKGDKSEANVPKWKQHLPERKGRSEKPDKGSVSETKGDQSDQLAEANVPKWKQKLLERKGTTSKQQEKDPDSSIPGDQSVETVPKWKQKLTERKGTTETPDKGEESEAKKPGSGPVVGVATTGGAAVMDGTTQVVESTTHAIPDGGRQVISGGNLVVGGAQKVINKGVAKHKESGRDNATSDPNASSSDPLGAASGPEVSENDESGVRKKEIKSILEKSTKLGGMPPVEVFKEDVELGLIEDVPEEVAEESGDQGQMLQTEDRTMKGSANPNDALKAGKAQSVEVDAAASSVAPSAGGVGGGTGTGEASAARVGSPEGALSESPEIIGDGKTAADLEAGLDAAAADAESKEDARSGTTATAADKRKVDVGLGIDTGSSEGEDSEHTESSSLGETPNPSMLKQERFPASADDHHESPRALARLEVMDEMLDESAGGPSADSYPSMEDPFEMVFGPPVEPELDSLDDADNTIDKILSRYLGPSFDNELSWEESGLTSTSSVPMRTDIENAFHITLPPDFQGRFPTPASLKEHIDDTERGPLDTETPQLEVKKSTQLSWCTMGILQALLMIVMFILFSAPLIPCWLVFEHLKVHPILFMLLAPIYSGTYSILVILAKWVVVGRYEECRMLVPSVAYLRWWFCDRLVHVWEVWVGQFILDTPLIWLFYVLMGAQISPSCQLAGFIREFDLVSIGSNASLKYPCLKCRKFQEWRAQEAGPTMVFRRILVSKQCTVRGMLSPGTRLEEGVYVEKLCVVPEGGVVEEDALLLGNPAYVADEADRREYPRWGWVGLFKIFWVFAELAILYGIWEGAKYINPPPEAAGENTSLDYYVYWAIFGASCIMFSLLSSMVLKFLLIGNRRPGKQRGCCSCYWSDWAADYHFNLVTLPFRFIAGHSRLCNIVLILHGMSIDFASKVEMESFPPSKMDLISVKRSFLGKVSFDVKKGRAYRRTVIEDSSIGHRCHVKSDIKLIKTLIRPFTLVNENVVYHRLDPTRAMGGVGVYSMCGYFCLLYLKEAITFLLDVILLGKTLLSVFVAYLVWQQLLEYAALETCVPILAASLAAQGLAWNLLFVILAHVRFLCVSQKQAQPLLPIIHWVYISMSKGFQDWSFIKITYGSPLFTFLAWVARISFEGRALYFGEYIYDTPLIKMGDRTIIDGAMVVGHNNVYDRFSFDLTYVRGIVHEESLILPNGNKWENSRSSLGPWVAAAPHCDPDSLTRRSSSAVAMLRRMDGVELVKDYMQDMASSQRMDQEYDEP